MTIAEHAPRVFFSAERTLLAWVRTGLTIMALGFVIARFGLFVKLVTMESQGTVKLREQNPRRYSVGYDSCAVEEPAPNAMDS